MRASPAESSGNRSSRSRSSPIVLEKSVKFQGVLFRTSPTLRTKVAGRLLQKKLHRTEAVQVLMQQRRDFQDNRRSTELLAHTETFGNDKFTSLGECESNSVLH